MAGRGDTITVDTTLITEECCNCGVLFAMPTHLKNQLLKEKETGTFYCPRGHAQHYVGKTDAQKAKEAREKAAALQSELDQVHAALRDSQTKLSTERKKVTAARKAAAATQCPAGCHRTFQPTGMQRHLKTKHPTFTP